MDAGRANPKKLKKRQQRGIKDRHGWNTLESYELAYHNHINNHPFVDHSKPLPEIELYSSIDGHSVIAILIGEIYCKQNIVVKIKKGYKTQQFGKGLLKIKCFSYCYNASIIGKWNILRYDNLDSYDDYHKHVFDTETGKEIARISLKDEQAFPLLHEVIDELQQMFET